MPPFDYDDSDAGDISLSLAGTRIPSAGAAAAAAGPSRSTLSLPTNSQPRPQSPSRRPSQENRTQAEPLPTSQVSPTPLAPAPQRFFSKTLFGLGHSTPSDDGKPSFVRRKSGTGTPNPASAAVTGPRGPAGGSPIIDDVGGGGAAVSLNDDDDDDTPMGLSGASNFWSGNGNGGTSEDVPNPRTRSVSANPGTGLSRRTSASGSAEALMPPHSNGGLGLGMGMGMAEGSALSGSTSTTARPTYTTRRASSGLGRSRSLNVRLPSVDVSSSTLGLGSGSGSTSTSTLAQRRQLPLSAITARATPSSKIGWSRRPGEPRPPPLVSESVSRGMSRWIKELVVCNFDLERGPVVERRAGGRRWGPGEKENVAFSSFPDTSLFTEGSILFSFKIRHIPPDPSSLSQPEPPSPMPDRVVKTVEEELLETTIADPPGEADVQTDSGHLSPKALTGEAVVQPAASVPVNGGSTPAISGIGQTTMSTGEKAAEYRLWDERGREWLYGYVWFEQRRDKGITRGYMQKSLVILTHLPFPALFAAILQRVAPVFFEYGYSALEAACHSIATWPDPVPDAILELPLMSHVITAKLPDMGETPQIGQAFGVSSPDPARLLLAALPTSTPLRAFASFLPALWSLWECLILAEPVLVIAPDPKTCSEIVWWLREMLRPIPPAGDFRPYLHIHDHDFSLLVNSNKPQPGVVVGVTNPFFRNAASHWPNVISIPAQRPRRMVSNGVSPVAAPPAPSKPDQPEGFISRRHRSVQKDRGLLKRLEALVAEGKLDDPEGNEALRTHFQRLTERFLVPLNRYFQTLVPTRSPSLTPSHTPIPSTPLSTASSQHSSAGGIRPFSLPTFLSHLKTHGPNPLAFRTKGLSTKTRVENDFYASFCMSATFARWLAARVDSLGLAVAAQNSMGASNSGNTLMVPNGMSTPTRSPSRSPSPATISTSITKESVPPRPTTSSRPNLTRQASVGLGITSSDPVATLTLTTDGRTSPAPIPALLEIAAPSTQGTTSESERSRLSSEADDESVHSHSADRQSHEEPHRQSPSPGGFGGRGRYSYGDGHSGRRASEGFVHHR